MADFPDWLTTAARKRGLETQAEISRAVGVGESVVGRWRLHGAVPDAKTIRKISEGLHVPVQEVLVAAGYVRPEEVGFIPIKIETLSNRELLAEVARRLGENPEGDESVVAMGSAEPFEAEPVWRPPTQRD